MIDKLGLDGLGGASRRVEPASEVERLQAENAALKADAERYRHIRKGQGHFGFEVRKRDEWITGKKLDAAIDAAMKLE